MILINLSNKKEYFVPLKKSAGEEVHTCPECSESRKKKTLKCFSFNHDKQAGYCSHCQITLVLKREFEPKKEYKRPPTWKNQTQLSAGLVKWFEARGINQQTLIDFKISEGPEWMPQVFGLHLDKFIQEGVERNQATNEAHKLAVVNTIHFNYFRNGEVINAKFRDGFKNFKLYKDAELILYNLDSILHSEEVVICEGEPDAMAMHQAGYKCVVSVPNGAGTGKINLEYLDNCIEYFLNKTKIYLATDDDLPGRNLQEQLAERLGKERCYKIKFKDCKDANDCLIKYGTQGIIEAMSEKIEFPLEGISTIEDYSDEITDLYHKGLPKGAKTQMANLNKLISFHTGYFTTITGIPGMGKSDAVDQITLDLTLTADWKGAFYSPENKPTSLHISKLARKLIGKSWWGDDRITKKEIEMVKSYLNDRFFFIKPEKDFTLDTILGYVKNLVLRKGIKFFVIDAWNKLEHKYNGDENKYIGECLDKIGAFCEINGIHGFIVAHPRKMLKSKGTQDFEVPNLYDINGSANWFNKSDNGICVHRDYNREISTWYVQKVKFSHWGNTGMAEFKYDIGSGRFNEYNGGVPVIQNNPWIYEIGTQLSEEKKPEQGIISDDGQGHSF